MAAVGVVSAVRRCVTRADCCKFPGLFGSEPQCRHVQTTGCVLAKKSLLKKFLSKTKKKFWYESPTLGSQLLYKPSSLANVLKPQRKMQKEDTFRMRTLNNVLYKAITELLNSNEVNPEVYDHKVELSKVERLLEIADYGSEEEAVDIAHVWNSKHFRQAPPDPALKPTSQESTPVLSDLPPSSPEVDLFGIDHDLLNRQILEYKKKSKKLLETNNSMLSEQHQEQLAYLKKLKRMKKKKSMNKLDDITPEIYLLEKYNMDSASPDTFSERDELKEMNEEVKELEEEEEDPRNQLKTPKET
ncbi:putative ribosome-binding factor A, mitochondrial isoform X2 [Heterodontus francisci]|uniref:putative ribosome-binding factor A, mitochondrial isoform X2 n=1 Tax=Heterodontus francisci TaxID=7792 RepID=UPI00355C9D9C